MERYILRSCKDFFQVIDQRRNTPVFFLATLADRTYLRDEAEDYVRALNRGIVEAERIAADRRHTERRKSERRASERRMSSRASADRRTEARRNLSRRASKRG
jgi:hypothetical protein